jgi:hypothetical protein
MSKSEGEALRQDHDLDPGIREYTRLFMLPQPVPPQADLRNIIIMTRILG